MPLLFLLYNNIHLAGVEQLWVQQVQRQVALDDAPLVHVLHFVDVTHHVTAHEVHQLLDGRPQHVPQVPIVQNFQEFRYARYARLAVCCWRIIQQYIYVCNTFRI